MRVPKLFVADIDGTLVDTSRQMTDSTRKAIEFLRQRGVLIGLASGRPIEQKMLSRHIRWQISQPFDFYIGVNGGQIYDTHTKTMIEVNPLSPEVIKNIIHLMDRYECCILMYKTDDKGQTYMMGSEMNDDLLATAKRNEMEPVEARSIEEFYEHSNSKVMFRMKPEQADKVMNDLSQYESQEFQVFRTRPNLLEFCNPNVNKGTALAEYCSKYGIKLEETIAFGDMDNDNEMLSVAGHGVAMLNGSESTKACADEITRYTNDEDGLAEYIFRIFRDGK